MKRFPAIYAAAVLLLSAFVPDCGGFWRCASPGCTPTPWHGGSAGKCCAAAALQADARDECGTEAEHLAHLVASRACACEFISAPEDSRALRALSAFRVVLDAGMPVAAFDAAPPPPAPLGRATTPGDIPPPTLLPRLPGRRAPPSA